MGRPKPAERRLIETRSNGSSVMKTVPAAPAYAGFVSRLFAFCIDFVVVVITALVVVSLAEALLNLFTVNGIVQQVTGQPQPTYGPVRTVVNLAVVALAPFLAIAYPIGFWTIFGATPGMMLMGLYLRRVDGRRVSFWRAIVRWLGSILSTIPLFLGFAWIAVDDRRQGWDDKLADTLVVFVDKPADLAQVMRAGRSSAR
jgi:uncharacterized RDD family membrane protein YckC